MDSLTWFKWVGTALQLAGAYSLASRKLTPARAYWIMLVGAVVWSMIALLSEDWPLLALQGAFCGLNILGITRWWRDG